MEDSLSISNRCLVLNIKFHGQSILYVKKKAKLSIYSLKTRCNRIKSHRIDSSTVSVCISCGKVSLLDHWTPKNS